MTLSTWMAFFLIAFAAISTPGPGNLNTMRRAVQFGWQRAVPSILGNAAGLAVLAIICVGGVAVLLTTYGWILRALSLAGITYLTWLGLQMIFSQQSMDDAGQKIQSVSAAKLFTESFTVSASNPKAVVFYLAVLPQFLDQSSTIGLQVALVVITCCLISLTTHSIYAYFASRVRRYLTDPGRYKIFRLSIGVIFIAIAVGLAMDWIVG